jgi:nucleoid-associated protein YgaU
MEKSDIKHALKHVKEFEKIGSFISGVVVAGVVVIVAVWGVSRMKFRSFTQSDTQSSTATPTQAILTVLHELPTRPDLYEKDGQYFVKNLPAVYEVKPGDSSWKVALAVYGSGENYRDIESENNMKMNQDLVVGQKITLPDVPSRRLGPATTVQPQVQGASSLPTKHVVQNAEGLWQIAERYYNDGYQYMKIFEANRDKMKSPEDIRVGMELSIPQ